MKQGLNMRHAQPQTVLSVFNPKCPKLHLAVS
jgi:hypothetical protein